MQRCSREEEKVCTPTPTHTHTHATRTRTNLTRSRATSITTGQSINLLFYPDRRTILVTFSSNPSPTSRREGEVEGRIDKLGNLRDTSSIWIWIRIRIRIGDRIWIWIEIEIGFGIWIWIWIRACATSELDNYVNWWWLRLTHTHATNAQPTHTPT